jgi:multiple sugar transport system substrate-binding protein
MEARERERRTVELAESYLGGRISRRAFIGRLLAIGLTTSAAGAVLAACTSGATAAPTAAPTSAPSAAPTPAATAIASAGAATPAPMTPNPDLTGRVRFFIGPWTDRELEVQKVIADAFNVLYPKVEVSTDLYDWGTASAQMQASAANGDHDLYHLVENYVVQWSPREDLFADISHRVNDPAFAAEKDQYRFWDRIAKMGPRLIGLPDHFLPESVLFVNLDLAEKAGYGTNLVDSEESFLDACVKMTQGDTYGIAFGVQTHGELYGRILSAGADYLTPDLQSVALDTPEMVQEMQYLADMFTKQKCAVPLGMYDYTTMNDAFIGGKIGVISTDATIARYLEDVKFKWDILPWPPGPKAQATFADISLLGFGAKSDNDAVWEAGKFWTNPQWNAWWCDYAYAFPAQKDAVANGWGKNLPPQTLQSLDDLLKVAQGPLSFPQWNECQDATNEEAEKAYLGQASAEQAVKTCADRIKGIVFG